MLPQMGVSRTYAEKATLNLRAAGVRAMGSDNENSKQSIFKRLFTLTWEAAYQWIVVLFLATLVTWLSQHKMPSTVAHPAEYWLETGTIFLGTLVLGLAITKIILSAAGRIRKWRHPPSLRMTARGGRCAAVEIRHSGVPATWEAHIRILRNLEDHPNRNPLRTLCFLQKGGRSVRSLSLVEGEYATIVLASIRWANNFETFVVVPNAEDEATRVYGGAVIELDLTTDPPNKKYSQRKCFMIARINNHMECAEAECPR
jgi:hypothetical protein